MAKKKGNPLTEVKRELIEPGHPKLSVRRQCGLLGLNRSSYYYRPAQESEWNLELMRLIDEQYLETPFYGYRRMTAWLREETGRAVNQKRVSRLMRLMGIQAIGPQPRATQSAPGHRIYPYLLAGVKVRRVNQVWSADITYIRMVKGFMYLVAVMDWFSRYVIAWEISNTLDGAFCLATLNEALEKGKPEIFNTDQGVQFTAKAFTGRLEEAGVRVSMDGRGRFLDNIFVERLWRSVKQENIYLNEYETGPELFAGLERYFSFYNYKRYHQSLNYRKPAEVWVA